MPRRNAAVLTVSPSKAGNEICPSGVFQVTVYSGITSWLKCSFAGLVLPCWLVCLTNRDALRIRILGRKPQMLGAIRRAIVRRRNVATICILCLQMSDSRHFLVLKDDGCSSLRQDS
jgi:hypothetical protein